MYTGSCWNFLVSLIFSRFSVPHFKVCVGGEGGGLALPSFTDTLWFLKVVVSRRYFLCIPGPAGVRKGL